MKCLNLYLLVASFVLFISSCSNAEQEKQAVANERDSLLIVNSIQQTLLDNMTSTMSEVSSSLDSITAVEQMIIMKVDENGNRLNQHGLKAKVIALSELIKYQKEKMSMLECRLDSSNMFLAQMKSIISFLNESLAQKDTEIEKLKNDLSKKNFKMEELELNIAGLRDTVSKVSKESKEKDRQIESQDLSLNEVFYVIGTKKELDAWGITSKKNLWSKRKINFADIDSSVLTKVDRRKFKELLIESPKAKIVGVIPENSYTMEKMGNSTLLRILDETTFWSSNNKLLVIQIK